MLLNNLVLSSDNVVSVLVLPVKRPFYYNKTELFVTCHRYQCKYNFFFVKNQLVFINLTSCKHTVDVNNENIEKVLVFCTSVSIHKLICMFSRLS